jgi:hypothetical protein
MPQLTPGQQAILDKVESYSTPALQAQLRRVQDPSLRASARAHFDKNAAARYPNEADRTAAFDRTMLATEALLKAALADRKGKR